MQCSNSWFYGQRGVSRINVIPLKIFFKRFNEERNTQVNEKEKKRKLNMNNYPIQWDLIGINGKNRIFKNQKYKNNCL